MNGYGDGSALNYFQATRDFIIELTPYYFLYPMFVGGICFPRPLAALKVRCSNLQCSFISVIAAVLYFIAWDTLGHGDLHTISGLRSYSKGHLHWSAMLPKREDEWHLLRLIRRDFDLYCAVITAYFTLLIAGMMPVRPTPVSLMGTRVLFCYLTLPLTLIAAGHFVAPCYLHIAGAPRGPLVQIGVLATIVLVLALTSAQGMIPDAVLRWASAGGGDSEPIKDAHGCGPGSGGAPWSHALALLRRGCSALSALATGQHFLCF